MNTADSFLQVELCDRELVLTLLVCVLLTLSILAWPENRSKLAIFANRVRFCLDRSK